jgi:hypothetical protein
VREKYASSGDISTSNEGDLPRQLLCQKKEKIKLCGPENCGTFPDHTGMVFK